MTFDEMIAKSYEYADAIMADLDALNKKFAKEEDKPAFEHFGLAYVKMEPILKSADARSEFAKNFMTLLLKREKANHDVEMKEAYKDFIDGKE